MRFLYNVLFNLGFWLAAPYYFWRLRRRGNWREGFGERFGRYSARVKMSITNRHVLWMHAVSVGEVNLCAQLIEVLEPRVPNIKTVISTTTTTGMAELRKKLPERIEKIYYPIDFRRSVSRALKRLHPEAVVLVEAEIWPNFLWKCRDRRIPTFLVNARLSDRSYRGYKRWGFLFRPIFASLNGVGAQNEDDARRLIDVGCRPEAVHVMGSLKFDSSSLDEKRRLDVVGLLRQLGVPREAPILVAGSTHAGEEAVLAEMLPRLRQRFPDLFLILVPRHFERGREVGRDLEARGVRFRYRREITAQTQLQPGEIECLLVNTTGELRYIYKEATVVFIGKSLCAKGGQNPIEPGMLGKPIVFGPNMQNFRAIADDFVRGGGALQVEDAAELEQAVVELLEDPDKQAQTGRRAIEIVRHNSGGVARTVNMIVDALAREKTHVAGT